VIGISACIISFQEEDRIGACLESLGFCDELLVLDSGSTDRTREVAAAAGARVEVQVPFLGHRDQKQRCVELARNDWVLCLDCDERVTESLALEIRNRLEREPEGIAGFRVPRRNRYLGKWMRFGSFWPDRKLRLFDRRRARWGGTDPHDRVEVTGGGEVVDLASPIEHDSYRDFAEHRRTVENFAAIAARAMAEEGRRATRIDPWARGAAALCKAWFGKAGVLDGWRGVVAGWMSARYDYLKYRELRRRGRTGGG